jgi:hypothetical protein
MEFTLTYSTDLWILSFSLLGEARQLGLESLSAHNSLGWVGKDEHSNCTREGGQENDK